MFSKKATKIIKSSPLIRDLLNNGKSTLKILSICVAFLENMNFTVKKKLRIEKEIAF